MKSTIPFNAICFTFVLFFVIGAQSLCQGIHAEHHQKQSCAAVRCRLEKTSTWPGNRIAPPHSFYGVLDFYDFIKHSE